jgi:hypothetical protein
MALRTDRIVVSYFKERNEGMQRDWRMALQESKRVDKREK